LGLTPGERVNVDAIQTGNLLAFPSNIPTSDVCNPGGSSWLYFFDISKGSLAQAFTFDAMLVGLNAVQLPDGRVEIIAWDNRGRAHEELPCANCYNPNPASTRRISWRELVQ
jgi:type IV pilus assembly protein PilY1